MKVAIVIRKNTFVVGAWPGVQRLPVFLQSRLRPLDCRVLGHSVAHAREFVAEEKLREIKNSRVEYKAAVGGQVLVAPVSSPRRKNVAVNLRTWSLNSILQQLASRVTDSAFA